MIEFKRIQMIEKIKPAAVTFLLNFTDEELHELTDEFKYKLKKYASYSNDGSKSEIYAEKIGKITIINVLIHYPKAKWPEEIEKINIQINLILFLKILINFSRVISFFKHLTHNKSIFVSGFTLDFKTVHDSMLVFSWMNFVISSISS